MTNVLPKRWPVPRPPQGTLYVWSTVTTTRAIPCKRSLPFGTIPTRLWSTRSAAARRNHLKSWCQTPWWNPQPWFDDHYGKIVPRQPLFPLRPQKGVALTAVSHFSSSSSSSSDTTGEPDTHTNKKKKEKKKKTTPTKDTKDETEWNRHYETLAQCVQQQQQAAGKRKSVNLEVIWKDHPTLKPWLQQQKGDFRDWKEGKRKATMTLERQEQLDHLKIPWRVYDDEWFHRYIELEEYSQKHGDCMVPASYAENPELAKWVQTQRRLYRNLMLDKKLPNRSSGPAMTKQHANMLDRLDFEMDIFDGRWKQKFRELVAYKKEHGNCLVPKHYAPNEALGAWVCTQRKIYQKYRYHQEQEQSKPKTAASDEDGSEPYSNNHYRLSKWRIRQLEQIKFEWDPNEQAWNQHYQNMVTYMQRHGRGSVPTITQDLELATWVHEQRRFYKQRVQQERQQQQQPQDTDKDKKAAKLKPPRLTDERLRKLHEIGLVLEPNQDSWMHHYEKLVAYRNRHGHVRISHLGAENIALSEWIKRQRALLRKRDMNPERMDLLQQVGIE